MRHFSVLLSLAVMVSNLPVEAALQSYPIQYNVPVITERGSKVRHFRETPNFRMEILSDDDGLKSERVKNSRPFVTAASGERYAVRLYNPLPVRVAVNLTVDGINTISGKPSGIEDGEKWLIDPYSSVTIRGWQVNGSEARRFFFTDKPKSYAQWRGEVLGKDLAANCGVIGAAYFWNQQELQNYWDSHPIYNYSYRSRDSLSRVGPMGLNGNMNLLEMGMPLAASRDEQRLSSKKQEAGTGMGERELHPTTLVDFHYDTGMYKLSQALVVYYDFAQLQPIPNPFPALSYAPEM